MSAFNPYEHGFSNPHKLSPAAQETFNRRMQQEENKKHDLKMIELDVGTATPEYMEHLKLHYHVISDRYQACQHIATGDQSKGVIEDPNFHTYCDKMRMKLRFQLNVLESAHPSLMEYKYGGWK